MKLPSKPWLIFLVVTLLFILQYILYIAISGGSSFSAGPFTVHGIVDKKSEIFTERVEVANVPLRHLSNKRIAVLLPYLGKSLPVWFDLFAFTAQTSAELVDWYIFITEAPMRAVPSNVHLVRLSRASIFRRLAQLDQANGSTPERRQALESYFQYIVDVHPYILVEIKPALGFLFSDYTKGYSHWAYADLDLLVGRMHLQITPDLLDKHDIVTLSFGDNHRLYMRGQFTIHRNTPEVTALWQGCAYLAAIGARLERFFEQKKKKWDFHSAEGCYSRVVADNARLSVAYLPVQFSDAFPGSLDQKETLLVGGALTRCYGRRLSEEVLRRKYSTGSEGSDAEQQQQQQHQQSFSIGSALKEPEVKSLNRIMEAPLHCSYWIDPADQVCTEEVPPNATITLIKGKLSYSTETRFTDDHCREASIAHFQGWKREYFAYTSRLPPDNAHAMVVTEAGIIPLKLRSPGAVSYGEERLSNTVKNGIKKQLQRQRQQQQQLGGRLYHSDLVPVGGAALRGLRSAQNIMFVPRLLPVAIQQTRGSSNTAAGAVAESIAPPPGPGSGLEESLATVYCIQHSADLKRCEQLLFGDDIAIMPDPRYGDKNLANAVTLITVGWLTEFQQKAYNLAFDGPRIFVLAHVEMTLQSLRQVRSHLRGATLILVNVTRSSEAKTSSSAPSSSRQWRLPDKTLFNIGLDAAGSDLVLLAPARAQLLHLVLPIEEGAEEAHRSLTSGDVAQMLQEASLSDVFRTAGDAALITPVLVLPFLQRKDLESPGSQEGPLPCGREQPASLKFSLKDFRAGGFYDLPFNGQELSQEHTVMLPVAFNASASPHGRGFFRFPEELNGVGCHGAFLLRALAGSGFKPIWSVSKSSALVARASLSERTGSGSATPLISAASSTGSTDQMQQRGSAEQCKCFEGIDAGKRHEMVTMTNRYFQKAVELRRLGLGGTFSRERFGITMEQNQRQQGHE